MIVLRSALRKARKPARCGKPVGLSAVSRQRTFVMTISWKPVCLTVTSLFLLGPAAAWAQSYREFAAMSAMTQGGSRTITAGGVATVQRKPTQLRLYMQLTAKGKTLDEALAKLKDRREAATAQLETLKADKKSIVFGSPSMSDAQSGRRKQIEMVMAARMRASGKKVPKAMQAPQTVTVSATLTAQWPLEADSPEKLLVLTQKLQDKIKAADLAGSKEAEKLSPEEEEVEEEVKQMTSNRYEGDESASAGQPQFLFVATLPKEERQKLLAEAFTKAKKQAGDLAKAAGVEIGPLVGLSGNCSGQNSYGNEYSYDSSGRMAMLRQVMAAQQGGEGADEKEDEAIGNDPAQLRFSGYAQAMFQLGK
jgi:hypothetical protein